MILQVDAIKLAEELALIDSQGYLNEDNNQESWSYTLEMTRNMLGQIERKERVYPNLFNFYTSRYDYYFVIITNHAL